MKKYNAMKRKRESCFFQRASGRCELAGKDFCSALKRLAMSQTGKPDIAAELVLWHNLGGTAESLLRPNIWGGAFCFPGKFFFVAAGKA